MRRGLGRGKGKGYFNLIPTDRCIHSLSAKGIKTKKPVIQILPRKKFDKLFADSYDENEVGYATTRIDPEGHVNVYVKDSGDKARNKKLIRHELEELKIFNDLVNNKNVPRSIADEMAHNLNPVKLEGVSQYYELDEDN